MLFFWHNCSEGLSQGSASHGTGEVNCSWLSMSEVHSHGARAQLKLALGFPSQEWSEMLSYAKEPSGTGCFSWTLLDIKSFVN